MGLSTPEKIRQLQRKLYLKAKQEPKFRFYALYDKLYRQDILLHAYRLVRANQGSPGIDGVSFSAIESREGVSEFLAGLEEELREKTYQPSPIKRVWIPKANGKQRPLGLITIRDRVAQQALKLVIEPIFEADLGKDTYGFRPRRSAHDAVDAIASTMIRGKTEVIDADLNQYFDTIPHANLMKAVAQRISDGQVLHLLKSWLKVPIIEVDKKGKRRNVGGGKKNRYGTAQGSILSPLLANVYLNILVRIWEKHELEKALGARLVVYADDFVILCSQGTEGPLGVVKQVLERLELTLNVEKTRIVNSYQESFDFLGFEIRMRKSFSSGKYYPHVQPARKSIRKIKQALSEITDRKRTMIPLKEVMAQTNHKLRGWSGYFHYRNCSNTMASIKFHAEERLRIHLRKRHKIKTWQEGYQKFPNQVLYKLCGLYKLPTSAPWKKAHALR